VQLFTAILLVSFPLLLVLLFSVDCCVITVICSSITVNGDFSGRTFTVNYPVKFGELTVYWVVIRGVLTVICGVRIANCVLIGCVIIVDLMCGVRIGNCVVISGVLTVNLTASCGELTVKQLVMGCAVTLNRTMNSTVIFGILVNRTGIGGISIVNRTVICGVLTVKRTVIFGLITVNSTGICGTLIVNRTLIWGVLTVNRTGICGVLTSNHTVRSSVFTGNSTVNCFVITVDCGVSWGVLTVKGTVICGVFILNYDAIYDVLTVYCDWIRGVLTVNRTGISALAVVPLHANDVLNMVLLYEITVLLTVYERAFPVVSAVLFTMIFYRI